MTTGLTVKLLKPTTTGFFPVDTLESRRLNDCEATDSNCEFLLGFLSVLVIVSMGYAN